MTMSKRVLVCYSCRVIAQPLPIDSDGCSLFCPSCKLKIVFVGPSFESLTSEAQSIFEEDLKKLISSTLQLLESGGEVVGDFDAHIERPLWGFYTGYAK